MWTTERLAEWVRALDAGALGSATRTRTEDLVVDTLGAALAGFRSDAATSVRVMSRNLFAPGPCRTWFTQESFMPAAAAMQNSAAASAMDLDDGHRLASGHPGAAVIPAVIAEAQAGTASDGEMLTAIVAGYEVGVRAAMAQHDRMALREFASGRWSPLAVAAAVGSLRKSAPAVLAQALAIAAAHRAQQIPSGMARTLGEVKEGIPWGTLTGFAAMELAQAGLTASLDVLDIPARFDAQLLVAGLGTEPFALDRAYTKPYSCCRWIHAPIDALAIIMREHRVRAGDIARIDVETIGAAVRLHNAPDPATQYEAQFSVPFCMAIAAIEGPDALLLPDERMLGRADVVELASRVGLQIHPGYDAHFPERTAASVVLHTARGTFRQEVQYPRGDFANPMRRPEILEKFRRIAVDVSPQEEAARMSAAAERIEESGLGALVQAVCSGLMMDIARDRRVA